MAPLPHRALLAVSTLLLTATLLAGCGDNDSSGDQTSGPTSDLSVSPSDSAATQPTVGPDSSPSDTGATSTEGTDTTVSAYYLVDTRAGLRLAREPHQVPADDPAKGALTAMIAGPDDPDYTSPWNRRTLVRSVQQDGNVVTVDLSKEATKVNVDPDEAAAMAQQLVYTVTGATDPKARVRLLVEGQPVKVGWGSVDWSRPVRRADPLDTRVLVSIDSPGERASVDSPVEVSGEAAAFEANVPWRVLDANGKVVRKGHTMTSEGMTFSPYSFTVRLPAGVYTVEVSEDDPSGGEGGTPMTDDRTITVS